MIRYRLIHNKKCLCDNLSEVEAHNLFLLYKEQHPNWKMETQKYNYDFGGKHWGRDPDLH